MSLDKLLQKSIFYKAFIIVSSRILDSFVTSSSGLEKLSFLVNESPTHKSKLGECYALFDVRIYMCTLHRVPRRVINGIDYGNINVEANLGTAYQQERPN